MAPRKAIILLSLLSASATRAHWIPFDPELFSDPISDARFQGLGDTQKDSQDGLHHTHRTSTPVTQSVAQSVAPYVSSLQSSQPVYGSMFPRTISDYEELASGLNDDYRYNVSSNRTRGCPSGNSDCGHLGRPDICCPEILFISPDKISIQSSCFKMEGSEEKVVCCSDPIMCERVAHHPSEYPSAQLKCRKGFNLCPSELRGGCCPDGYDCGIDACYEHRANDKHAQSSQDSVDSESYYMAKGQTFSRNYPPLAKKTQTASLEVSAGLNGVTVSRCPGGFVYSPVESVCYDGSGIPTGELIRTDEIPRTETASHSDSAYPTGVPRHSVLKSAVSVFKTGETEECVGFQCPNPLAGLVGGLGEAIQNIAGGSAAVLTLTQAIATNIPGASGVLEKIGVNNNTLNIINSVGTVLGGALKSDGVSYVRSGPTSWPRIFSAGYFKHLAVSLVIHGVVGLGLNPGLALVNRRM
ncbi:hypothetical protein TWF730_002398 [Orbilia blumenaviensis]|uniref:Uncharacterized protein n=1 Tax=Orbilia blumenaviensis TaxID=1796055 RepID=A0AAV9UAN9_9PEZI